jgi:hypothetical protein
MNLARLFMLGNLSADVILPDDLPDWLERIPKNQREEAWKEHQLKLKAEEWKKYEQQESEIQLPKKLPEWIEQLPEYLRKEAWGAFQHQFEKENWAEIKRKTEEWKTFKERGKEWLKSNPQAGPRSVRAGVDEEIQIALKIYPVLELIRDAWISHHYPEAAKEHIKYVLSEFTKRSAQTIMLVEQAEVQIANANSLDKSEAAIAKFEGAKNSLVSMNSILQVFEPLFDKQTVENQKHVINDLFKRLKEANTLAYSQKLKQSFQTIAPMPEMIRTASRQIINGDLDPSAFSFLKSAATQISRTANSILANPAASIQEQNSARETINLSESLKLLINTAITEFTQEVKTYTPQLSFPERFAQKTNVQLLSKSADATSESYSRHANPDERLKSLKHFINSADAIFSLKGKVDPSIIPVIKDSIEKVFPAIRSVASILMSRPPLRDEDGKIIWRDELEKVQHEGIETVMALKTLVQMIKESKMPARSF